jgi:hypothetical protein
MYSSRLITVIITILLSAGLATNGFYTPVNATTEQQDQNETAAAEPEPEVEPETEPGTNGPDEDCLFDPSLPKCTPGPEGCPEGFNMNENGQCFPRHEEGCPEGYHSHEDDESGRCIPDSVPCDEGYIMNPDFPSCDRKESVCQVHPELNECITPGGPPPQPPQPPQPEPGPQPQQEAELQTNQTNTNQTNTNQTGNATIITINNAIAQAFSRATYNTNILQQLAQNTLLVGEETVPLQGMIRANDSRLLSTFDPFRLIGGSAIIYLPTSSISSSPSPSPSPFPSPPTAATTVSGKMQILALDGDSNQVVVLPSIKMPIAGNAYKTVLGEAFQGTNPFSGNTVTVNNIKALFLFNRSNQTITFGSGSSIALLTIVR